MKNVLEFSEISRLLKKFPRTSKQINAVFESDCEIVRIPGGYLSTSVDAIGEEIDIHLYEDPELWGWMTIMSSVSDLAASGSSPSGVRLANQWKYKTSEEVKARFFSGAQKALNNTKIPLLGGDSGSGESHCHSATILGHSKKRPLTRSGAKPGDVVCLVGRKKLGIGPSLAYRFLLQKDPSLFSEENFRPSPNPQLIQKLRPFVSASIDTSDGFATSLQILRELNNVGFAVSWNTHAISEKALTFCSQVHFHPLMLMMGDHGDYQTLLIIPEKNLKKALAVSKEIIPIGIVTPYKHGIKVHYQNQFLDLPAELVTTCPRDVASIFSLTSDVNKLFNSQSSPTSPASKPAHSMTPKAFGEEK